MNRPSQSLNEPIYQLNAAIGDADIASKKLHNWWIDEENRSENEDPDLLQMISKWAEARHFLYLIQKMTETDRDRQRKFPIPFEESFETLEKKTNGMDGAMQAYEEDDPLLYQKMLNEQLEKAIAEWKSMLESVEEYGFDSTELLEEDDLCDFRDKLEYTKGGLQIIRLEDRLTDLPYFEEYCKKVEELDVPFKKVLKGKTLPRLNADKTFWWRQRNGSR